MGGDINGRLEISSFDLEKTQAELRQTFNAAEKFRRELEYLQKGGNPLDLKCGDATSVSGQSTSLPGHHLTSGTNGNFGITASPLNDSVGSSGKLKAHLVCEPNSADNLVLFDGNNKFPKIERTSIGQHARASGDYVALEVPKKSYKRRNNRSRINRDGARLSPVRDVKRSLVADDVERVDLSGFNSKINGSSPSVTIKNLDSNVLDGVLAVENKLGQIPGSSSVISNGSQNSQRNRPDSTKVLDSESSCTQKGQTSDVNTSPRNINCNGKTLKTEQILESNEDKEGNNKSVKETECTVSDNSNCNFDSRNQAQNEDNSSVIKEVDPDGSAEKWVKESEPALQDGSKNIVSDERVDPDGSAGSETERKPCDGSRDSVESSESTLSVRAPDDVPEQPGNSQNDLNLATKEHEDSILKEAQIIEEKNKRMSELCLSILSPKIHQNSHWDFVIEEMAWLANDFAQERLWKLTAAAQISRRAVFASHIRFQQKQLSWKLKEVAQTLGRHVMEFWHMTEVKCKDLELTESKQGLQRYIMRFLKYNNNSARTHFSTENVSSTPDLVSDVGITGWDDNVTEENLVYTVPPGAAEAYRKSIESHMIRCERTRNGLQEEVDTSKRDAVADNNGATRVYSLPGESEAIENNIMTQPSDGKRSGDRVNVSFTTNRVITASRQRVIGGPFNGPNKTEASSDETNSFQDEYSGGAHMPNNMEAQSVGPYEKQLWFGSDEVSDRPRKKKKAKHQGSSFKHGWQFDSSFQNEQKDHLKRRLDVHQLDNGSNGLYIQHNMKKPKIKQPSNDIRPFPRSVSSPMISNMSNQKKLMELLVRDGGKNSKNLKAGQPGSGSLWSLFEDQLLVVLVHDMGPNWELISDLTNTNLQLKCMFRSSKECKERHKVLMDRSTGDRADSPEDSGSGQPYPSTLPGIPEGSARQLFQRLQGPMEEQTLKSHFEKIIVIGRKQYNRRKQKHNQDPKQLQPPHSSFRLALSQVSPNNLNGRDVLTPFDLCDAIESTPDAPLLGCQSSHNGGLQISDHGNGPTMLPGSNSSSFVSGSATLASGNEFSSVSVPLNPSIRDGRCGVPKKGLLPKDDQQTTQQYNNHMLSARTNVSPPGSHLGMGRPVRMLPPVNNNVGAMSAVNRGMPIARPAFRGAPSPSMPSTVNNFSRVVPGHGSSIPRPHDTVHLMRPNIKTEHQRKIPPVSQVVPQFATNISNPGFGTRFVNERQLQQHKQFTTSNPMMPPVQSPKSRLPVTSPQNNIEIKSQKPSLLSPHEMTGGNHIIKQQGQSHPFQQHQQKTHFTQVQAKLRQQKPDNNNNFKRQNNIPSSVVSSSIMPHQKLLSAKKIINNELVNFSEPSTSKVQTSQPQTSGAVAKNEPV